MLAEAQVIDDKAKRGEKVGKLCGLPVPVKDNIDIAGYKTVGGTPALEGGLSGHTPLPTPSCAFFLPLYSTPLFNSSQASRPSSLGKGLWFLLYAQSCIHSISSHVVLAPKLDLLHPNQLWSGQASIKHYSVSASFWQ